MASTCSPSPDASDLPLHDLLAAFARRLERLEAAGGKEPGAPGGCADAAVGEAVDAAWGEALSELRALAHALKRREARHVGRALAEPDFAFQRAQEDLAAQRALFARLARRLARGGCARLGDAARREALDLAYLLRHAPLTDAVDLAAIRASRAARASRRAPTRAQAAH